MLCVLRGVIGNCLTQAGKCFHLPCKSASLIPYLDSIVKIQNAQPCCAEQLCFLLRHSYPYQVEMSRTIILPKFNFGFTWLIVIPAGIWAIVGYYLPLFSENLTQLQTWIVTLLIVLMIGVSLVCHILAHLWIAKAMHREIPTKLTLLIFGDVSQSWLEADSSWQEIVIAGTGPIMNLLLAGLAYVLWNAQINYFVSLIALCVSGFNAWIFVINLLPAFPMDGGRIIRACLQGLMKPSVAAHWIKYFGFLVAVVVTGWGIFLIAQRARFSTETGLITFLFA